MEFNTEYRSLINESRYEEAKRVLEGLSEEAQHQPDVIMCLADCCYELASFQEAIAQYSKVIECKEALKYWAQAYYNRGLCWRELDEYEKALVDFVAAGKDFSKSTLYIGETYSLMGDFVNAYKYLRDWQKENGDKYAQRKLAWVSNQLDKHQESLELFQQLLTNGESDYEVLDGILTELDWLDRTDDIKEFMNNVLSEKNDPSGSLRYKARDVLEDMGENPPSQGAE